jgi:spore coat protein SA
MYGRPCGAFGKKELAHACSLIRTVNTKMGGRQLKVLQVSSNSLPVPPDKGGAIETYIQKISDKLRSLNVESSILTIEKKEDTGQESDESFYHKVKVDDPICRFLENKAEILSLALVNYRFYKECTRTIDVKSPDIIHAHYFPTFPSVWLYGRRNKKKIIFSAHSEFRPSILTKFLFERTDLLLAVSEYIKKAILSSFGMSKERVRVVHNAIDTHVFRYEEKWREDIRRELNVGDSSIVLYVGRMRRDKGVHTLIDAIPSVLRETKTHFLFVGGEVLGGSLSGDYTNLLMDKVRKYSISSFVNFLGSIPLEQLVRFYSAADVVVVPSIWNDPCPSVVLEAMSSERAVIGTERGGIPEMIKHEENGILVPDANPEKLADWLVHLLQEPNLRKALGSKGRVMVENSFSIEVVSKRLKRIYEGLLS